MEYVAVRDISKYFPETRTLANDGISLGLGPGEILAVVGENGAGKSTFARILAGLERPDSGEVLVRGEPLRLGSVRAAEAEGIGLVPQHFFLAESLSLAAALALGREPRRAGFFFDHRRAFFEAAELIARFGFHLDPEARVGSLSPAERRQAEILRALHRGGELLILDEPTSLLTETEIAALFSLIKNLAGHGRSILFITHRAAEVRSLATRLAVLRAGRLVADLPAAEVSEGELARLMAGTAPEFRGPPPRGGVGDAILLEARDLVLDPRRNSNPLSFSVRQGEVYGLIGLAGNGLDELERIASGFVRPRTGAFLLRGRALGDRTPSLLRRRELSYVPADREGRGLVLDATVADNLLVLERDRFSSLDRLGGRTIPRRAREVAARLSLAAAPGRRVRTLSGGNRQRLLLARELGPERDALLLVDPTQGLDLAAQEEAVAHILERKRAGAAILLLSSNLEELLRLSDRIGVLYRGSLVYETPNTEGIALHELTAHMTGLGAA